MQSVDQQIVRVLEEILKVNSAQLQVTKEVLDELNEITHAIIANGLILQDIADGLKPEPSSFTLEVKELNMATTIAVGGTGQLGVTLLDNGAADTSGFALAPTFTADDASVTFAPATVDASGGTIPLAAQTVVSVPAGDAGTSVTITASATAPDGTTATGTIAIPLTAVAQTFTLAVTQLA